MNFARIGIFLGVSLLFAYFSNWYGFYHGYSLAAKDLDHVAELATGMINKCVNGTPYKDR